MGLEPMNRPTRPPPPRPPPRPPAPGQKGDLSHTPSNASLTAHSEAAPAATSLSDILDRRIDSVIKEWHRSSDLLFAVHPIDGYEYDELKNFLLPAKYAFTLLTKQLSVRCWCGWQISWTNTSRELSARPRSHSPPESPTQFLWVTP